jgi:MtrB/PioB family decaheme-associated outer membrane protein
MTTLMNLFTSRIAARAARAFALTLAALACTTLAMAQTAPQTTPAAPAKPAADQTAAPAGPAASSVEVGGGDVSSGSFKAGEYNGLENKGGFAVGRFDLRGGGTYDSPTAFRWRIIGTDLGLETRAVTAEIGVQGSYRFTFGYSELLRNRSDSYQTPYNGAGTNTLTLPSSWLVPQIASSSASNNHTTSNSARGLIPSIGGASYLDTMTGSATLGKVIAPNATQLAAVNASANADVPLFHNVDLYTKRTTYDAGVSADLAPSWGFAASVRAEHKDGLKPLSTVSSQSGSVATAIPDLIDTDTTQVNSSLTYKGGKVFAQAAYYGSFFTNHVASMSWQNWLSPTSALNTMSSDPNNAFNQFSATGRYNFSPTTHLVANASYGRNTQNDAFLTDASTVVVPVSSLNGLVVSTAFDAKLTTRLWKKLNVTGFYKFNDKDNQTAIHIFQFSDADSTPSVNANFPASSTNPLGAVLAQNANANRPYSRKVNLASAEAEYTLAKNEWLKAGYNFERNNRWCTGSWIDCADAGITNENSMRAEWRANIGDAVQARVGYTYSQRRTPDYNENAFLALVPYANVSPTTATGGATALSFMQANGWTGWGPALGYAATTGNMNVFFPSDNAIPNTIYANNNRISELVGMRRYYVADKDRNRTRSAFNWQLTDALSVEAGLDYTGDTYTASTYGVQSTRSWTPSVDGTYEVGDGISANGFYSYEQQRSITNGNSYTANSATANVNGFTALSGNACDGYTSILQRNNNAKLDPCLNWSANMVDRVHTLGFTLMKKANKADVSADVVYSRARSDNNVTGGSWSNNLLAVTGAPAGTIAAYFIAAAPLPTVSTDSLELRANARITVATNQSLRMSYSYMRMRNVDYQYDSMQIGAATLASVMPTNEQPFNYNVHVVAVSYLIRF